MLVVGELKKEDGVRLVKLEEKWIEWIDEIDEDMDEDEYFGCGRIDEDDVVIEDGVMMVRYDVFCVEKGWFDKVVVFVEE